jgi:hypothetical protein
MEYLRSTVRRASFTRPSNTTTYGDTDGMGKGSAAQDCVLQFPASVPWASRRGEIKTSRLWKSGTGVTADAFELLVFQSLPASDPDDNVAATTSWIKEADSDSYVGTIAFATGVAGADAVHYEGAVVPANGIPWSLSGSGGQFYGILQAVAAYEPASAEVFIITLGCLE